MKRVRLGVVIVICALAAVAQAQEDPIYSGPDDQQEFPDNCGEVNPEYGCYDTGYGNGSGRFVSCTAKGSAGGYCVNCQYVFAMKKSSCVKAYFSASCHCVSSTTDPNACTKTEGYCTYYK